MDRRAFLTALGGGLLTTPLAARAQPATKTWRIGFLTSGFREGAGADVRIAPFSRGLRELGYIEGRNVILETRYAEGRVERFPALAAELVELKVDVLVATSTPGALAAKRATSTIPIVMAAVGEPVEVSWSRALPIRVETSRDCRSALRSSRPSDWISSSRPCPSSRE
jgi:putative ABC transport system substrate-binding protein